MLTLASLSSDQMATLVQKHITDRPEIFPPSWGIIVKPLGPIDEMSKRARITLTHNKEVEVAKVCMRCDLHLPYEMAACIR